jgi:sugar lactone lactonase YvrE
MNARAYGIALCALAAAASLAAGCGGGGGQMTSTPSQVLPPPSATSTPVAPQGKATVALRIVIPAASTSSAVTRRPRYVSPSTNSLSFAQNASVTTVIALTPSSPNCTTGVGGVRTCTVNVNATAGQNQSFTLKTFASADGTGTPLSTQTIVATIVPNTSNPLTFVLNGVVASLTAAFAVPTLPYGLAGTTTLTVNALDASGNIIIGPGGYATSSGTALTITLTNADNSGATSLTHSSLTQPGAADGFTYAGGPLNGDTVTASAPGVTSAAASIVFTCNPTPATSALYVPGDFTNWGYGLYPLSLPGASPAPSNVVDPPGILGYPIAVDADGRAYTWSGSFSTGIPQFGAAIEEFCPQATGIAAVPYRSIVTNGAIAVDPARHLYVLNEGGSGSLLEFAPDAGTPGFVPSTAPTTAPIRTISGSNTEINDAGNQGYAPSGYAATNSNFYFSAYNELLSFSSTQTGNVAPTLVAADTAPGLLNPESVAVDKSGNVYVLYQTDYLVPQPPAVTYAALDLTEPAVAEYTPQGVVSRVISGTNTDMGDANGIAVDGAGNLWVSSAIQYIGETGVHPQIESFNSTATGNANPTARFTFVGDTSPLGTPSLDLQQMAIDPTTANIYICDSAGYGVLVFNSVGNYLGQIWPSVGGLGAAYGIAFNANGSFVVQSGPLTNGGTTYGSAQLRFYPAGTGTTGAATPAPTKVVNLGSYAYPAPIAVDGSGNVFELGGENGALSLNNSSYLGDSYTYTVAEFAAAASGNATPVSTFYDPANLDNTGLTLGGIGLDPSGDVLVGNNASNVVYLYHAGTSGSPVSPTSSYQDFAPSTYFLQSMAADPAGNIYVASFSGATITEFAAGTSTVLRTIYGPHTRILEPDGIAVDSSDNIYLGNQYGATLAIFGPTQSGDVAPQRTIGTVEPDSTVRYEFMAVGPGDALAAAAQSMIPTQRAAAAVARRTAVRHEALATISAQATARCAVIRKVPPPQNAVRGSESAATCEAGLVNAVRH